MVRPSYSSKYDKTIAFRAIRDMIASDYPQLSRDQRETLAWSAAEAVKVVQVLPLLTNLSEIDAALTRAGVPEIVPTAEHQDVIDQVADRLRNVDLGFLSAHEADRLHAMLSSVGIAAVTATGESLSLDTRLQLMINELLDWRRGAETAARSANVALPTEHIVIDPTMVWPLAETIELVTHASQDAPEAPQLETIIAALKELNAAQAGSRQNLADIRALIATGVSNDQGFVKHMDRQFSGVQADLEQLQRAQQAYADGAKRRTSPDRPETVKVASSHKVIPESNAAQARLMYDLADIRSAIVNRALNDQEFVKGVDHQFSEVKANLERLQRAQDAYVQVAKLSNRESKTDFRDRAKIDRLLNQAERLANDTSDNMHEQVAAIRVAIAQQLGSGSSLMFQLDSKFHCLAADIEWLQRSLTTHAEEAKRQAQDARDRDKPPVGVRRILAERITKRQPATPHQKIAELRDAIVNRLGDDAVYIRQLNGHLAQMQADFEQLQLSVQDSSYDAEHQTRQARDEQAEVRRLIGQLSDIVARLSGAINHPSVDTARRLIQEGLESAGAQRAARNFPRVTGRNVPRPAGNKLGKATKANATPRAQTAVKERIRPIIPNRAPMISRRDGIVALIVLTLLVLVIIGGVAARMPLSSVLGGSLGSRSQLMQEQLGEKFPVLFQSVVSTLKSQTERAQEARAFTSYDAWLADSDDGSGGLMLNYDYQLQDRQAVRLNNNPNLYNVIDPVYGLRKDGTKLGDWKLFLSMLATEKYRWPKELQTPSRQALLDNALRDVTAWVRGYEPPSIRSAPPQPLYVLPTLEQQYAPWTQSVIFKVAGYSQPCIPPSNIKHASELLPDTLVKAHACLVSHLTPTL